MEYISNKVAGLNACNLIKKRLQHRCFPVNIAKSLRTSILKIICKRLLLPLEVFCIRNLLILAMRMLHLAAAYLFFNYNCIFAYEISFSDTRKLYSIYGSNQPLWKIHGSALINFDCFAIDESNQVKIFRVIMRCQGYFLKIALWTRLEINQRHETQTFFAHALLYMNLM